MRKLTDEERELTEKGIKRVEKDLIFLEEDLEYNKAVLNLQQIQREFEDNWRERRRRRKDDDDAKMIKLLENEIENKKLNLQAMNEQLTDGVKEKGGENGN